jgi:ComEC/Rec2-related protein
MVTAYGVIISSNIGEIPAKWYYLAALSLSAVGITVISLRGRCDRWSKILTILVAGASLSGLISGNLALCRDQSDLAFYIATVDVSGLRGRTDADVFVEYSGTHLITVVPETIYYSDGALCESSSYAATRFELIVPLDRHLSRGEVIFVSGLTRDDQTNHRNRLRSEVNPERIGYSRVLWRIRATMFARINELRFRLEPRSSSLFGALFLGISDAAMDDVRYFIRMAGCIHLLALSGMHVAILIAVILAILSPIMGTKQAKIVAIPMVAAYTMLVGMPPALLRACIMYTTATMLSGSRRRYRGLDVIAASFLLGTIIQPESLHTLSFVLTYVAVLGISIGARPWTKWLMRCFPTVLASPIAVSISAFSATAPFVAAAFGAIYPFGIAASLVIAPIVALFLAMGVAVICVEIIWPIRRVSFTIFYELLELAARCIEIIAKVFSRLPAVSAQTFPLVVIFSLLWVYILRRFARVDPLLISKPDQRAS